MPEVVFRAALGEADLPRIQRLNHQIFAEELGQYARTEEGLLGDRFSRGSRYFIAERGAELLGMISVNATPPFSVERRLPSAKQVLAAFPRPCEIRMLAVVSDRRAGLLLAGLYWQAYAEAKRQTRSHLLISGVSTRLKMYRSLGFRVLGAAVCEGEAAYVPMVLDMEDGGFQKKVTRFRRWWTHSGGEV